MGRALQQQQQRLLQQHLLLLLLLLGTQDRCSCCRAETTQRCSY